ncbi:putative aarF domain-containing protein kinase 1 [Nymphon striatum]|nr:putative aarF domain-containing protein kinase 1 [Nymphon striatum]
MLRRLLKLSAVGMIGGSAVVLHSHEWDASRIGVMRFGRAAVTVSSIVYDYKKSLKNTNSSTDKYRQIMSEVHKRSAEKLLSLCCVNGGSFIKVGQHIGALDYLLPKEYVGTMKILHNQAPKATIESVKEVLKEELKQDVSDLFSEFDEMPVGAASLAQVHRAKLKDGKVVAVKVQHKDVQRHSYVDIKSMELLVHIVAKIFPNFSFLWLANEMKINLPIELDFVNEGNNAEKVEKMFSHLSWLKIPKVYWEYSTRRVLTMEFVDGYQINDLEGMIKNKIPVKSVVKKLGHLYSEMIFIHGFVHCDPHPGNILVKNTSSGLQIILLDHGLYMTLKESFRHDYSKMWLGLINANVEDIQKYSKKLGVDDLYPLLACMMTARSWDAINFGIDKKESNDEEAKELQNNVVSYFPQINTVLRLVPREMLLIFKTFDLLRSIESCLKTVGTVSFVIISMYCVESVYRYSQSSSKWGRFKMALSYHLAHKANTNSRHLSLWFARVLASSHETNLKSKSFFVSFSWYVHFIAIFYVFLVVFSEDMTDPLPSSFNDLFIYFCIYVGAACVS